MLVAMLATWAREGEPRYKSMASGQTVAYVLPAPRDCGTTGDVDADRGWLASFISDVGAQGLKPLFVAGSVVMVVFLDLAFLSERWLRHAGQLVPNKGFFDKACAVLSIFFAIAGAAGLVLLSIFDTVQYPRLHDGFLLLFL